MKLRISPERESRLNDARRPLLWPLRLKVHRALQPPPAAPRHRPPHPAAAWAARPRAVPANPGIIITEHFRVRRDKIDSTGTISLRHNSQLHHIGIGRAHAGARVLVLALGILTEAGQLLRQLELDPSRDYQPQTHRV